MMVIIERDEEQKQRKDQEEAFAKQLGGQDAQRGLNGRETKTPKKDAPGPKAPAPEAPDKVKQQLSQKDRQIQALAGQLKAAGFKPDFAKAHASSRQPSSDGKGKGGGKGDRSKSPKGGGKGSGKTADGQRACFTCGSADHLNSRPSRLRERVSDS